MLAAAAETYARDVLKLSGLVLHAQLTAEGFYKRVGYVREGEPFLEEDIVHVSMQKRLVP